MSLVKEEVDTDRDGDEQTVRVDSTGAVEGGETFIVHQWDMLVGEEASGFLGTIPCWRRPL